MINRIYKYATGDAVPHGATYLYSTKNGEMPDGLPYPDGYEYVWHYFLVEEEK